MSRIRPRCKTCIEVKIRQSSSPPSASQGASDPTILHHPRRFRFRRDDQRAASRHPDREPPAARGDRVEDRIVDRDGAAELIGRGVEACGQVALRRTGPNEQKRGSPRSRTSDRHPPRRPRAGDRQLRACRGVGERRHASGGDRGKAPIPRYRIHPRIIWRRRGGLGGKRGGNENGVRQKRNSHRPIFSTFA